MLDNDDELSGDIYRLGSLIVASKPCWGFEALDEWRKNIEGKVEEDSWNLEIMQILGDSGDGVAAIRT